MLPKANAFAEGLNEGTLSKFNEIYQELCEEKRMVVGREKRSDTELCKASRKHK